MNICIWDVRGQVNLQTSLCDQLLFLKYLFNTVKIICMTVWHERPPVQDRTIYWIEINKQTNVPCLQPCNTTCWSFISASSHLFFPSAFGSQQTPRWLQKSSPAARHLLIPQLWSLPDSATPACLQFWGKRSKRHLHPQNGDVLLAERWILQEHLGATACVLYISLPRGWGTSEVSKEERTVHCLSKLRNNWLIISGKNWRRNRKKFFFF